MRKGRVLILLCCCVVGATVWHLREVRPSPEVKRATEVVRKTLPAIDRAVGREISYTPDLKPRSGLEGVVSAYSKELNEVLSRPTSATAPISDYAPLVKRLVRLLSEKKVSPDEQSQIIKQVGKELYNEALIRQGYDIGTRLAKIRLLKMSLAHLDGARELAMEKKL